MAFRWGFSLSNHGQRMTSWFRTPAQSCSRYSSQIKQRPDSLHQYSLGCSHPLMQVLVGYVEISRLRYLWSHQSASWMQICVLCMLCHVSYHVFCFWFIFVSSHCKADALIQSVSQKMQEAHLVRWHFSICCHPSSQVTVSYITYYSCLKLYFILWLFYHY